MNGRGGDRPWVRNAADPKQVRAAGRKQERRELEFLNSVRATMATIEGRAVMWGLLERAGVFRSVWDPSARIHYNAGRQDFGHELLSLLLEADEQLYLLMEQEARQRARSDARETAAYQAEGVSNG